MPPHPYELVATYFRACIKVGVSSGDEIIRWADDVIVRDPAPPSTIYDVSLAPPGDLLKMYDALAPLATFDEPIVVVRALLDRLWQDLRAKRRPVGATVALVYRASYAVVVPESLLWEMVALDDDYSLAEDGVIGDLPTIQSEVRKWLAQFDGALDALFDAAAGATPVA